MDKRVICALDTSNLQEALGIVRRCSPYIGAFKVGHALTLTKGLDVLRYLYDEGAQRIFLDLKFHDIPNSVALAVREATRYGVWMMTLHTSGGPAMMTAAAEETENSEAEQPPLLVGVSVLTSLDQNTVTTHLGIQRTIAEHMIYLSDLAIQCGLDGIVCSAHEVAAVRQRIGRQGIIVCPGIRAPGSESQDQRRVGTATQAIADGADYLVIGRALSESQDIPATLGSMGLLEPEIPA